MGMLQISDFKNLFAYVAFLEPRVNQHFSLFLLKVSVWKHTIQYLMKWTCILSLSWIRELLGLRSTILSFFDYSFTPLPFEDSLPMCFLVVVVDIFMSSYILCVLLKRVISFKFCRYLSVRAVNHLWCFCIFVFAIIFAFPFRIVNRQPSLNISLFWKASCSLLHRRLSD